MKNSERWRASRLRAISVIETLRDIPCHNRTDGYDRVAHQHGITVRFVRAIANGQCWKELTGGVKIEMTGIDARVPKFSVDPSAQGTSIKT